jgi:hypothetical protein
MNQGEPARAFRVRIKTQNKPPNVLEFKTIDVKIGKRVFKTATVLTVCDDQTGEIRRRELIMRTHGRSLNGPGFSFDDQPEHRWYCEGVEIGAVKELLNDAIPTSGVYDFSGQDAGVQQLITHIDEGRVDADAVHRVVTAICNAPDLAEALARMDEAGVLADVIERNRQLEGLRRWRQVVEDPSSTEPDIQKVLEKEWWVFGGRYIKPDVRRELVPGDELDLLLARADGSLHIVEIKQANIRWLTKPHRSHYRVGNEVHEAVSQVENYLRSLDEQRDFIKNHFRVKIDPRRASATVVIGHPKFVDPSIPPDVVAETIRTYNSHLSRVEVMTFADLIEGAEGSFALADADTDGTAPEAVEEQLLWPEPVEAPWPEPRSWSGSWEDDPPF